MVMFMLLLVHYVIYNTNIIDNTLHMVRFSVMAMTFVISMSFYIVFS